MKNMSQTWFEMPEIRKRFYDKSVWIPLRESKTLIREGEHGHAGFREEYFGIRSIAVFLDQKKEAEKIEWSDLNTRGSSTGYVEGGEYFPAHIYKNYEGALRAEHLIVESRGNSIECGEWYLSPDLIATLNLKREGDTWLAIQYGYEEVVKMERNENGCVTSLSIKAVYLKDYLCARKMALYMVSYRLRTQVMEDSSEIKWPNPYVEKSGMDRWEGRVMEIHEGGHPFGSKFAVMNVSRTDVDFDEDVPEFKFATDEVTKMDKWEGGYNGRKLFCVEGELWRQEWVEPASVSQIVLDEEVEPTVYFITDNSGKTENRKTLVNGSRWLWFKPSIINTILAIRGSSLDWYTKDTGSIECSSGYNIHFGMNKIGLVNVYAKDIGTLPDWQQKIWAGHNVPPDGKVSAELLMSQMEAKPATTQAPEDFIQSGIELMNTLSVEKYRITLINEHTEAVQILSRTHRFRAISKEGLFELAKDLYRLTGERINASAIKGIVKPAKEDSWGPLKSLEKLLALEIGDTLAYKMMSPLWGIYTLRNSDSHLPSNELEEAYKLNRIDIRQPLIIQGFQMLNSCVSCLYTICKVLKPIITKKDPRW